MMNDILTKVKPVILHALEEDIGDGDVTTLCTVPDTTLEGRFIAKESGVISGLEVAGLTFSLLDEQVRFTSHVADGDRVEAKQIFATVRGPGRAILSGERVALNFLQRMSGIATLTRQFADAMKGASAVILDTRKTAPGLRIFDKWAVRSGGGQNHRFGLYDMVLIKDNHIAAVGTISETVARVRSEDKLKRAIEIEVRNLEELREALELSPDRILLDNMTPSELSDAVRVTDGRVPLEASGNVSLENITAIAASGVDYISAGMLTHSTKALDITLLLTNAEEK
ncbi:carboxylating nicotinate-nucleotide diphosphorylase [Desulfococcaceae bacterium HSG8]|nr:carboxylating nicotinate-nucleotide diphosphorylase [Desulfococcaceae bacterium HSG8]